MTATETVLEFISAINARHIDKMVGLMTPDHKFVDSLGKEIPGRASMRQAWIGYFEMIPDYEVVTHETFANGQNVVVLGSASGTYTKNGDVLPQNSWEVPAAWRAVVQDQRVALWQAFVDNEPLRRIMRFCGETEPD